MAHNRWDLKRRRGILTRIEYGRSDRLSDWTLITDTSRSVSFRYVSSRSTSALRCWSSCMPVKALQSVYFGWTILRYPEVQLWWVNRDVMILNTTEVTSEIFTNDPSSLKRWMSRVLNIERYMFPTGDDWFLNLLGSLLFVYDFNYAQKLFSSAHCLFMRTT